MSFNIKIVDKEGNVKACDEGKNGAGIFFKEEYSEGDKILVSADEYPADIRLQIDDAMGSSLCYLTGPLTYEIPFAEKRTSYSAKSFMGNAHYLFVKAAPDYEVRTYRNLSQNVNDQHGDTHLFPHAYANVETRGEAVFAARNAIDGVCENRSHGEWPYESWGINRRDDAEMTVDFGREIETDRIVFYERADFPHDNWWVRVSFEFSDGSVLMKDFEKSYEPFEICFEKKRTSSITIKELIKADDPSPFPALTQIEVFGEIC